MKKNQSNARTILNHLGKLSGFLTDLDTKADIDDRFKVPLVIIQKTMLFDVSVLYRVSNIIDNRLILEIVKIFDPKGLRPDLKQGRKIRVFLDKPEKIYVNEVTAFKNKRISFINVPGTGCDIIGYVYLPESFGGAYLFGGDFCGKESSVKDYEVAGIEIMCNFLSTILLKTQFQQQAEIDHLTGLFNSGKIRQKAETIVKRFERKLTGTACIALGDIDFFKQINDTYGHIQGDQVLTKIGEILLTSMRGVFDVAGRYGGEEFLLIFDETTVENAYQIVERLRKTIQDTDFELAGHPVTMSFGIASLTRDSKIETSTAWIENADKALYLSKQNGRNQTTVHTE